MIATKPLLLLAALAMATMPQAAAEEYTFTTRVGPRQIRGATDGAGNVARFNLLRGLAVDRAGNLYVFQLLATNAVTGEASRRTLELNAVPADVAVLASPQWQADGSLEWTLIGQASRSDTLQVSSDLTPWTDWINVTPESCTTPVTDLEATQGTHRFYRARTR